VPVVNAGVVVPVRALLLEAQHDLDDVVDVGCESLLADGETWAHVR